MSLYKNTDILQLKYTIEDVTIPVSRDQLYFPKRSLKEIVG